MVFGSGTVLVTGGAGYIGSHVVRALRDTGRDVVVVDDGSSSVVPLDSDWGVSFDITTDDAVTVLEATMRRFEVGAVIHLAARKQVEESVRRPAWYMRQNVGGLAQVLEAMERAEVGRLVFSSTAAVYGEVDGAVDELHPTEPINPYGRSKLVGEQLIGDASRAWGVAATSLRYFNVGGSGAPGLFDSGSSNLIPLVLSALKRRQPPIVFGGDYPTDDGTCVRDFVHVEDVAEAHLAALAALTQPSHTVYNIGTGRGSSVREVIELAQAISGIEIAPQMHARREGDPASVVAVVERIWREVGWAARYDLREIVASTWASIREA